LKKRASLENEFFQSAINNQKSTIDHPPSVLPTLASRWHFFAQRCTQFTKLCENVQ